VLLALGVDLEQVRQEIARNHQPSPRLVVQSVLPITEDGHELATRVLEAPRVKPLAIREAVRSFRADSSA
jgi:hypothetical protein